MSPLRRTAAIVLALLSMLSLASPALADDPVVGGGTASEGSIEPTGLTACDIRLSVVDGPLVDSSFSVRIYDSFMVWGFGYPADTEVIIEFHFPTGVITRSAMTDSAGEFAQGPWTFGLGALDGSVVAYSAGGCGDTVLVHFLPPHPFSDVVAFEFEISWLYREGITGGCTATRFCPSNPVTRGQMAAFLDRALGLPSTGTDFFDDDDGTTFEGSINRLAASGITGGCDTRRFCPNANVTREQMASFLVRTFHFPTTSRDFFTDDESSIHESNINRLAASEVTGGCASYRYCPGSNVTREQMAAFLYRAFNFFQPVD